MRCKMQWKKTAAVLIENRAREHLRAGRLRGAPPGVLSRAVEGSRLGSGRPSLVHNEMLAWPAVDLPRGQVPTPRRSRRRVWLAAMLGLAGRSLARSNDRSLGLVEVLGQGVSGGAGVCLRGDWARADFERGV